MFTLNPFYLYLPPANELHTTMMEAQNNLLNYYINYDVRKNRDYLRPSKGEITAIPPRGLTLANVVDNLNHSLSDGSQNRCLTPANSVDNVILIEEAVCDQDENESKDDNLTAERSVNIPPTEEVSVISNADVDSTSKSITDAQLSEHLTDIVNKHPTINDGTNDDVGAKEEEASMDATQDTRRASTISFDAKQRRAYRFNARPQLYDIVAKQRQFDKLYRLTDYESDKVKTRRKDLGTILTDICHRKENGAGEKADTTTTEETTAENELPVYLHLLANQPALVPISMLLPPGGPMGSIRRKGSDGGFFKKNMTWPCHFQSRYFLLTPQHVHGPYATFIRRFIGPSVTVMIDDPPGARAYPA